MINRTPDSLVVFTENGTVCSSASVCLVETAGGFHVDLSSPAEPVETVVLRWKKDWPEGARVLGDHWERGYGDLEWRGFAPDRLLPWYALIFDPRGAITHGVGVRTGAACFVAWRIDAAGTVLILDVRNGASGVRLGARTLRAATIQTMSSEAGETPPAFARRFCKAMCEKPRLCGHPVFGGNDWYYAYGRNTDEGVRRDAALIRELCPVGANKPYMVVDEGWFSWKPEVTGPYEKGNDRFPDMPGLAAAMEAMDVLPGIWIRPLLTTRAPQTWQMAAEHPIWKSLEGRVVLDPSVPEVLQQVAEDIGRLRKWGYRLIKHDFTTFDITGRWGFEMIDGLLSPGAWSFADRSRTTAEIISRLYQTIREAAGEVALIGCNTVGHLGAGLFELQRTGDDTSGKEWARTRKMGINTLAFRMPQHDTFFAADADCVGLTRHVPWALNKQWLDLLAASGTPLFVSADPAAVGPEQRAALKAAFARAATAQPPAEPLDWMETTCPRRWRFGSEERSFDWGLPG